MREITYKINRIPHIKELVDLYRNSEIRRPISDIERIARMYANSNLVITAQHKNELIGISRALTDFCYACYLSDLAVKKEFQKEGVGRELIVLTKKEIGPQTALILLSAPEAMNYYPKVGFKKIQNGFILSRSE